MLGAYPLASRPLASTPPLPRYFAPAAAVGQYGYAAWSYSRQAKLNAWSWHGLGAFGGANVSAWASLGNAVYLRMEAAGPVYILQPDTFMAAGEDNTESFTVEAETQWLDFGKPGVTKALTGMDFDGLNVDAVEVYVSVNGGRTGTLAASFAVSDNQGGWTYNGDVIPMESVGAATEFKLRFIGDPNQEVQVNRLTLYFEELGAGF